jgi:hypothetical protein
MKAGAFFECSIALMPDSTHDVGLPSRFINGIAHGFAVNCQAFVSCTILAIPMLESLIQFCRFDSDEYITYMLFFNSACSALKKATST